MTNPVPSSDFWQLRAMPLILTTLGSDPRTTGPSASVASGASTAAIGVLPNGCSTLGNPEVSNSFDRSLGTLRSWSGAYLSTWLSTFDSRAAAEIFG
ncbi:Uncharacterised protein [Mycobacteroides abscessus subsp. abscessus]|nr:Uncharacterised protein [Mycobacteroides abscessus subsp. abscessus]SIN08803.1 Uncharacterised protein [Mycobacteroides abscessus subsp. abscessus]